MYFDDTHEKDKLKFTLPLTSSVLLEICIWKNIWNTYQNLEQIELDTLKCLYQLNMG